MRTTIEISDERWRFLKSLAAERGEKGFSRVIEEAIDLLARENREEKDEAKRKALAALGSISEERGDEMQQYVRELREGWRDRRQ